MYCRSEENLQPSTWCKVVPSRQALFDYLYGEIGNGPAPSLKGYGDMMCTLVHRSDIKTFDGAEMNRIMVKEGRHMFSQLTKSASILPVAVRKRMVPYTPSL